MTTESKTTSSVRPTGAAHRYAGAPEPSISPAVIPKTTSATTAA